ncbi:hypothetical protein AGLY_015464 [Aphis glycines]|uniref:Uncharacterized protein n=1 Tax=Aphis glycines TaxID=307491 RepID=A0A6G0T0K0_APHGL|nr:hypothetical protein AGLY_015464 [Aphis glycines]
MMVQRSAVVSVQDGEMKYYSNKRSHKDVELEGPDKSVEYEGPGVSVECERPSSSVEYEVPGSSVEYEVPGSSVEYEVPGSSVEYEVPGSSVEYEVPGSSVEYEVPGSSVEYEVPGSSVEYEGPGMSVKCEGPGRTGKDVEQDMPAISIAFLVVLLLSLKASSLFIFSSTINFLLNSDFSSTCNCSIFKALSESKISSNILPSSELMNIST